MIMIIIVNNNNNYYYYYIIIIGRVRDDNESIQVQIVPTHNPTCKKKKSLVTHPFTHWILT